MSSSALARCARSYAIVLALCAGAGCSSDKLGPQTPASVNAFSGDSQTVLAGDRASAPLVAVVENSDGSPLPNVQVRWSVLSGGGSLTTLVDTTDANGRASNTYLSPAIAGTAKVFAAASTRGKQFTVIVAADTTGALTALEGDGAAALVNFPLTLVAAAVDRFGNPIRGVDVTWSASNGTLQTTTATTDSLGRATNVITVGPDTGKVSVTATARFNAVTFTVSALQGK